MQPSAPSTPRPNGRNANRSLLLLASVAALALLIWWRTDAGAPKQVEDRPATTEEDPSQRTGVLEQDEGPTRTVVPGPSAPDDPAASEAFLRVTVSSRDSSVDLGSLELRRFGHYQLPKYVQAWLEDAGGAMDPRRLRFLQRSRFETEERFPVEADGIARLTRTSRYGQLLVIHEWPDGRIAGAHRAISPSSREVTLKIVPPGRPLSVRVLDHSGLPAPGVPLRLTATVRLPTRFGQTETGPDGRAELFGWQQLQRRPGPGPSSDPLSEPPVVVSVVAPLEDPLHTLVGLDHDLDEAVEIQLPPTCTVEVRCIGFPAGVSGSAGLYPWPKMPGMFGMPESLSPLAVLRDGSASFRWVGVDYRFIAYAFLDGVDGALEKRIQSPKAPGGRLEVVFDAQAIPSFRGRLVGANGKAPRPGQVTIQRSGPSWSLRQTAVTDEFGQFQVFVTKASVPTKLQYLDFFAEGATARIEVEELTPGVRDLGVITLK